MKILILKKKSRSGISLLFNSLILKNIYVFRPYVWTNNQAKSTTSRHMLLKKIRIWNTNILLIIGPLFILSPWLYQIVATAQTSVCFNRLENLNSLTPWKIYCQNRDHSKGCHCHFLLEYWYSSWTWPVLLENKLNKVSNCSL